MIKAGARLASATEAVILTGMTHRVGAKGQIVIPKDLRDQLGIHPGSEVTFVSDENSVRVIPIRREIPLRGRYAQSGMAERLESDRRGEAPRLGRNVEDRRPAA